MGTRINRYLAEVGHCSRREADRLIEAGKVTIDGRKAVLGDQVEDGQDVRVSGRPVGAKQEKAWLAFHKPVGVITTTDRRAKDNIMDALEAAPGELPKVRLFPVGRLDVASSGLILFTNDSDAADKLLRAAGGHEKEYLVEVGEAFGEDFLRGLAAGVPVLGRKTLPAKVRRLGERSFSIIITEGRNRQIRRMCEALGREVKRLKRVRILDIRLGDLKPGRWRRLTEAEVKKLRAAVLK